jgi:hypothetical protein
MKMSYNFDSVLEIIKKSSLVSKIIELSIDEISNKGVYKIICQLTPTEYKLAIKYIRVENEITYSYQLFTDTHLIRWDNSPHYPDIETYPHHFHNEQEKIESSHLSGNDEDDLKIILSKIQNYINNRI